MNKQEFIKELNTLGIFLTKEQMNKLDMFYELLIEENKNINLTRITEKEEVYLKHFFDSLTLYKVVDLNKSLTLCDVGSGAGFPGIVLKIVFPNLKITLIDALQKRINYLTRIIKQLDLKNIEAIHVRSEDYARINREKYDIVTARAVANLETLVEITIPMVKINGNFIAMKANLGEELKNSEKILSELKAKIISCVEFKLPKEESTRTLVVIKKYAITPNKYPRNIDKIRKSQK